MARHVTEALGFVRTSEDDPRVVEGIAIPYGVVSNETALTVGGPIVREAWVPGSFRDDVARWMSRTDGARMAFRPKHGEKPVGTVIHLEDRPEGVFHRSRIRDTPAGNEYLQDVADGLNGVSVEASMGEGSRKLRDGTYLHRSGKLFAIAGSVNPAYDGARIALRDMEDVMSDTETQPEPQPAPEPPAPPREPEPSRRDAVANDPTVQAIVRHAPAIVTRAESVYGRESGNSFLRDLALAHQGDTAAAERQSRHNAHLTDIGLMIERAGDVVSSEIPGAYPNDYLPGLLTPRILKGRPMGGFYDRVPITNAEPKIFPKVTTSTTVAVQSAEGTNPAASDLATTAVTATPLLYGAETVVSRQVIDGGNPSAQNMIIQDMMEAYAQASETVIKTAVEAGASASGSAITAATPFAGLLANIVAYQAARFSPATGQFIPAALYSVALAQADTTGRPFYPLTGASNAQADVRAGGAAASILGADEFLSWASTTNVVVTGRPSDYVIFESSIARFSYDAVTGPAGVRIGIWAYLVVGTRLGSLKVTAA